ncbi:MAG: hypothetical protein AB1726_06505 [Planctomycetota bacterium]
MLHPVLSAASGALLLSLPAFGQTATGTPAPAASPVLPGPVLDVRVLGADALDPHLGDILLAYYRAEEAIGADRNGDGDMQDEVLVVFDRTSGLEHELGLALVARDARPPRYEVTGPHVLLWVGEAEQGATDLNGDGDQEDAVLFWYDHSTGVTANTGLAGDWSWIGFWVEGDVATFFVVEAAQGVDLSGDGDLDDWVLHVGHFGAGTLENTLLCSAGNPRVEVDGDHVLVRTDEACYGPGGLDLNGDGDASDAVLVDYDAILRTYASPRVAVASTGWGIFPNGHGFAFVASEAGEGLDLNGDGDQEDDVLHYYDRGTGQTTNHAFALWREPVLHGDRAAFLAYEIANGVDYNLDGDQEDRVVHVVHLVTGFAWNTHLASYFTYPLLLDEDALAFVVLEWSQGGQDLNGDGDPDDYVLHWIDPQTGLPFNTELAVASRYHLVAGRIVFGVHESSQGHQDFTGDGDSHDTVLHVLDTSTGSLVNEGLPISLNAFQTLGDRLEVGVPEVNAGGTDLNGDGDAKDDVLFAARLGRGAPVATGWTTDGTSHWMLWEGGRIDAEGTFLFYVEEEEQGDTDLNGDGDATDRVLCLGRIR